MAVEGISRGALAAALVVAALLVARTSSRDIHVTADR
jgi:hypothetical protein